MVLSVIRYRFQCPMHPRSICFNLEPPPSTPTSTYLVEPLKVTNLDHFPKSKSSVFRKKQNEHKHRPLRTLWEKLPGTKTFQPSDSQLASHPIASDLPPFRLNLIALQRCFAAVDTHRQGTACFVGGFFVAVFVAIWAMEKKTSYFQIILVV